MVPADTAPDIEELAQAAEDEDSGSGRSTLLALLANFIVVIVALWLFLSQTAVVPDVVGLAESAARALLEDAGFSVGQIEPVATGNVDPGEIASQLPAAGRRSLKGAEIDLTILSGDGVAGGEGEGEVLGGDGTPGFEYDPDYDAASADDGQDYQAPGTRIDYGPQVPSVQNMTESAALAKLRSAGYAPRVGGRGPSTAGVVAGRVYYQDPAPESFEPRGSTVIVWISTGAPTEGKYYPMPPAY